MPAIRYTLNLYTDSGHMVTATRRGIPKAATGIVGLDDITLGGLPAGRPTLLCGGPGCGKTMFGLTFLVNGIRMFGEHGVFLSFEERTAELAANANSLGYEVNSHIAAQQLVVDHVRIERAEIEESGEYDLEGLFVRLAHAIDTVNAKRVVLDTLEALFSGFSDTTVLRSEFRRLFAWLKDMGVTALITAERGAGDLTRFGIEEYVSDCVILLDHRVDVEITTRRIRIVKYRGSAHGTNEYPFLIDTDGISVLPITSASLAHNPSSESVSTGNSDLDAMFGLGGYYRGSSVLVSGLAGAGKSTLAAMFAESACARGEKCIYFAFEESPAQIMRNMRSVGIDLEKYVASGFLLFEAARPSFYGFEMHLARMNRDLDTFRPLHVVVDPISAFRGPSQVIHSALMRWVDICKSSGITAVFTSLTSTFEEMDANERDVSSLMDCWIVLNMVEASGQRNRTLSILKARGMSHSNRVHEFALTDHGLNLTGTWRAVAGGRDS
jgi:circadian clock protein KaiC